MGKVFQLLNKLKNHLPACHVAAYRALLLAQEGKIQPIFYNLEFSSGTLQVFYTLLLWSFPAPYFYSWLLALYLQIVSSQWHHTEPGTHTKNGLIILHIMPCLVGKSTVTPSMWHKITKLFRPIKGFEDYPKSDVDLNTAPIIIPPQTAPVFHAVSPLLSSPAPASVCSSFSRVACPGASVMVPACRAAQEKWQSRESASDL